MGQLGSETSLQPSAGCVHLPGRWFHSIEQETPCDQSNA
jgi:hypothetical protein